MTATDAAAEVARGRRILRLGTVFLGLAGAALALTLGGGLLAWALGWIAEDEAWPAVVGLLISAALLVTALVLLRTSAQLVGRHVAELAASQPADVPEELRIGTGRPRAVIAGTATLAVLGLGLVAWLLPPSQWVVPGGAALFVLVRFLHSGPSALNLSSAVIDPSGIRLRLHGIFVPWSAVGAVRATGAYVITIDIVGPVEPSGDQPWRWTVRAIARAQPGTSVHISVRRPEDAVRVARRYLQHPASGG